MLLNMSDQILKSYRIFPITLTATVNMECHHILKLTDKVIERLKVEREKASPRGKQLAKVDVHRIAKDVIQDELGTVQSDILKPVCLLAEDFSRVRYKDGVFHINPIYTKDNPVRMVHISDRYNGNGQAINNCLFDIRPELTVAPRIWHEDVDQLLHETRQVSLLFHPTGTYLVMMMNWNSRHTRVATRSIIDIQFHQEDSAKFSVSVNYPNTADCRINQVQTIGLVTENCPEPVRLLWELLERHPLQEGVSIHDYLYSLPDKYATLEFINGYSQIMDEFFDNVVVRNVRHFRLANPDPRDYRPQEKQAFLALRDLVAQGVTYVADHKDANVVYWSLMDDVGNKTHYPTLTVKDDGSNSVLLKS